MYRNMKFDILHRRSSSSSLFEECTLKKKVCSMQKVHLKTSVALHDLMLPARFQIEA